MVSIQPQKVSFIIAVFVFSLLLIQIVLAGRDFYKILGVSKNASQREIKKAFRELSLQYHPDKNKGNEEAQKKYIDISNAYEVLSDEDKRRIYDQQGEDGLKKADGGGSGFRSPFDFFNFGFGGGGHSHSEPEQRKGPSVEIPLQVTLEELYLGTEIGVLHKKQVLCPNCRGSGAKSTDDVTTCNECGGSGTKIYTQQLGPGFITQTQRPCDKCKGKGKIIKSVCPICKGAKVMMNKGIEDVEDHGGHLHLHVEKGMNENHAIVMEQENDETPDIIPGDVIFKIHSAPHKRFRRDQNQVDLHTKVHVSLIDALVGFTTQIPHLDGHNVTISKTDITKPGDIVTVEKEGMPFFSNPSQFGNLFVEFAIQMPKSLTKDQKEKLREIFQTIN